MDQLGGMDALLGSPCIWKKMVDHLKDAQRKDLKYTEKSLELQNESQEDEIVKPTEVNHPK